MTWCKLRCNFRELQLLGTLNGGQSFRWKYNDVKGEWTGVFYKTVCKLRQEPDFLLYQIIGSLHNINNSNLKNNFDITNHEKNEGLLRDLLINYFQFNINLSCHYEEWSDKDPIFKEACQQFYGIRILKQEPVENIFSFICSQNNHISRISTMIEKLCVQYGEEICEHDGVTYYAFPEVERLANAEVEATLRQLGFGYRAKFIQKSACQIVEWGGEKWFESLVNMKYKDARVELMKLYGIGPKVADCICLMSLQHLESVPVDTHVYQIAVNNYLPHLKGKKNVNEKTYHEIGDHFRNLYGPYAGWAHTVLFCADLKKFQNDNGKKENKSKKNRKRKCS